jgi:DNA gyrase subunit A
MRLSQLTGLRVDELHAEYDELLKLIQYLQQILDDPELCKKVMKDELLEVKEKFNDERRTYIDYTASENFNPEDFYPNVPVVITVSHLGYIKRTPLTEFRAQGRGGIGVKGGSARESDFIENIYPAYTHNTLLFFTQKGRCFWMKGYEIPEGGKTFKGRAIQNLLNIESDDKVTAILCVQKFNDADYVASRNIVFCTKNGIIKKTSLQDYSRPRSNGLNAININEGDRVIEVLLTNGSDEIIIANRGGRAIRFNEETVRNMGRNATGVRAIRLDDEEDDEVVGMISIRKPEGFDEVMDEIDAIENEEERQAALDAKLAEWPEMPTILVLSEKGIGKRSALDTYRIKNRNGNGVKTNAVTPKTCKLVDIKNVTLDQDIMIINKSGITIRVAVSDIKLSGRLTQGVKIIDIQKRNDVISSVCVVEHEDEPEIEVDENGNPIILTEEGAAVSEPTNM